MTALLERKGPWLFTSESVSDGHPDKICDQISDAFLDACLERDPEARVACEAMVSANRVILGGEYRFNDLGARLQEEEVEALVRAVVRDIGCEDDKFHWRELELTSLLASQSLEIADKVETDGGAGDQGIMFGYAAAETASLMPAPLHCAHGILRAIKAGREAGELPGLKADAKSQVTLRYEGRRPVAAEKVVVSCQHEAGLKEGDVRALVSPVVERVFAEAGLPLPDGPQETWLLVNPSGSFIEGGPAADAGLTGRKIIVDTYGGAAPHGGGAFSGKDPTKVDRSAAYAARYLAKNVVAAGLAHDCLIQVSYAIGRRDPCSFYLQLPSDADCDPAALERALPELFPLAPRSIGEKLDLHRPIYRQSASFGHFGRAPEGGFFPWERTELAEELKRRFA